MNDLNPTGETGVLMPPERAAPPPAPIEPSGNALLDMIAKVVERGLPIEYLDKVMELRERFEREEARKAFASAMAAAKAEMPPIEKDAEVDFTSAKGRTHYRHESIGHLFAVAVPVLARHGFSHDYEWSQSEGGQIEVTCIVTHAAGHAKRVTLKGPPDASGNKNTLQALKSTNTSLRREAFKLAIGLAARDEPDDDGRGAGPQAPEEAGPITIDQVVVLQTMLDSLDMPETRLLTWLSLQAKVEFESLEDIPANWYNRAKEQLERQGAKVPTTEEAYVPDTPPTDDNPI